MQREACTNQASSQHDGNWPCPTDLWGFCAPMATSEGLLCLPWLPPGLAAGHEAGSFFIADSP